MSYAAIQDMINRFGQTEMIRLSTPDGQDMDGIVPDRVIAALEDVSATIDSYIRQRYRTPLDVAPPEVVRVTCDMARYSLSTGDGRTPAEETTRRNDAAITWLRDIARGLVKLDLHEVSIGDESYAAAVIRGDDGSTPAAPFGRGGYL